MMDWSYGLLTNDEQTVLNQLAVFSGTFPLSGAETLVAETQTSVLELLDSLVEQSLVVASVDTGRYRLLETVRLYALDRLVNTEQLGAARDRHLAWMVELSGRERLYSTGVRESWGLEEQKLAETRNALAAMEWANQTDRHDALLSLYIGGTTYWGNVASVAAAVSWLDRVPEPPASEPELCIDSLSTSGQIRYNAGEYVRAYEQFFEAAAMIDNVSGNNPNVNPLPLYFRAIGYSLAGDHDAALHESDRLLEFFNPEHQLAAYSKWFGLHLRGIVLANQHDRDAATSFTEALKLGASISRIVRDASMSGLAIQLSIAGRYEEAVSVTTQCLGSPVLGQSAMLGELPVAANAFAGLGQYEAALDIVERDFGPMIDSQKQALTAYQLTALALILHHLDQPERLDHLARLALARQDMTDRVTVPLHLIHLVDLHDGPTALPDPADLTSETIEALITDVITEIRELIAQDSSVHKIDAE